MRPCPMIQQQQQQHGIVPLVIGLLLVLILPNINNSNRDGVRDSRGFGVIPSGGSISSGAAAWFVQAEKDSNPYPWGENPNNGFKMYWNDAPNVLQDLDKFSALYIKSHGCVWSECSVGDDYDDDGEDRDGGACVL